MSRERLSIRVLESEIEGRRNSRAEHKVTGWSEKNVQCENPGPDRCESEMHGQRGVEV